MGKLELNMLESAYDKEYDEICVFFSVVDLETGEEKRFSVRESCNAKNTGQIVSPLYPIDEGHKGGIAWEENGELFWIDYIGLKGWKIMRPLTTFEKESVKLLSNSNPSLGYILEKILMKQNYGESPFF